MSASTIQSPDGKYAVEQQDDYGEIGMGSPLFGHIIFRGANIRFPDYLFGEAVVFSPDSRFVALEQLVETAPFRTKLIAVELPRGTVHIIRLQPQGTVTPQRWESATRLIYPFGLSEVRRSSSLGMRQLQPRKREDCSIFGGDLILCHR